MFTGCVSPFHSGVFVSGHFKDLAAVAFLPPPRSPAKNMREPWSPPLLSHWIDEATSPISLNEKAHPVNAYDTHISASLSVNPKLGERNGKSFLKNVYCLRGLGIVRKNRQTPKHFNKKKNVGFKLNQLILYRNLFFLYDPLSTSLHGLKKSIIHGATRHIMIPRPQIQYGNHKHCLLRCRMLCKYRHGCCINLFR